MTLHSVLPPVFPQWCNSGRAWLALLLLMLFMLSGCSSAREDKPVIQVRIRSNRVAAQTAARNVYTAYQPTDAAIEPTATPTLPPLPIPDETISAPAPAPDTAAIQLATPTPLAIPIGRPDRIAIPSVDIDTAVEPVYAAQSQMGNQWFQNWDTASFAAGYHEGSALLGQAGNTVISGHNNIEGAVFRTLYQAQPGDVVHLYADGYRYDYVIEDQFLVKEAGAPLEQRLQNASWIQPTTDERVTLVSCWPPDGNEYRVIVVAKPVRSGS